jgi:hypothetical protein
MRRCLGVATDGPWDTIGGVGTPIRAPPPLSRHPHPPSALVDLDHLFGDGTGGEVGKKRRRPAAPGPGGVGAGPRRSAAAAPPRRRPVTTPASPTPRPRARSPRSAPPSPSPPPRPLGPFTARQDEHVAASRSATSSRASGPRVERRVGGQRRLPTGDEHRRAPRGGAALRRRRADVEPFGLLPRRRAHQSVAQAATARAAWRPRLAQHPGSRRAETMGAASSSRRRRITRHLGAVRGTG